MDVLFHAEDPQPGPWAAALEAALPEGRVHRWSQGALFRACDYAVCWKPPAGFFAGQGGLKAIMNIGAGADAIVGNPHLPAGVPVIRLDDAGMAAQMQEYVAACALGYLCRFDAYRAQQARRHWERMTPRGREHFPVGVMGLGVLGESVALYLRGLGFPVRGWSRGPKRLDGVACFAGDAQLDDFLSGAMLLVCLLPLTVQTRGILNRSNLAKLPRGACLVNIARGGHLVEDDLLDLLDAGQLAGATLDVFPHEPLAPESRLWTHDKVAITPHASAQTVVDVAMVQIAGKIRALERGETVAGLIDPARGY